MRTYNQLLKHGWNPDKILKCILAIHFLLIGAIGLDYVGFSTSILRPTIGFIYLTFIPGYLIVRIIKLQLPSNLEIFLYSVGLSLTALMFYGLLLNGIFPLFGIENPFSLYYLIIPLILLTLLLSFLLLFRDNKLFIKYQSLDYKLIFSNTSMFLYLIFFLSILGANLVNRSGNNFLLLVLLILISLVICLVAHSKWITPDLYPLAIFIISLSLLYHNSLISNYIWGWDINEEYRLSSLVIMNGIWDPTLPYAINGMLDIVILIPIYSIILNLSVTWVLKLVVPFLFSLVPLCLYCIYVRQTATNNSNNDIAFLSCIFFVSLFIYYTEMLGLARQQVAEIFLALILLIIVSEKDISGVLRSALLCIFAASLVVSHYGISYLYILFLIFSALAILIAKPSNYNMIQSVKLNLISLRFILYFIIIALSWYIYISSSLNFNNALRIVNNLYETVQENLINTYSSQTFNLLIADVGSPLHEAYRAYHLIFIFFIIIGVVLTYFKQTGLNTIFFYLSVINIVFYLATLLTPSIGLGSTRLYHIVLFCLSIFCVIGAISVIEIIGHYSSGNFRDASKKIFSYMLVIYLLFNTGFIFEIAKDKPSSISLSQDWIKEYGDIESKVHFYNTCTNIYDVSSAQWLSKNKNNSTRVLSDFYASEHVLRSYGMQPRESIVVLTDRQFSNATDNHKEEYYFYFRYLNRVMNLFYDPADQSYSCNYIRIANYACMQNNIYTNGGSLIYITVSLSIWLSGYK